MSLCAFSAVAGDGAGVISRRQPLDLFEGMPALASPDGRHVAFTEWEEGSRTLWISRAGRGRARRVAGGRGLRTQLDWSPDSTHLAYADRSAERQGIWVFEIRSGRERLLFRPETGRALHPRWTGPREMTFLLQQDKGAEVHILSLSGASRRVATLQGSPSAATLLPARQQIAWLIPAGEGSDLFVEAVGKTVGGEPLLSGLRLGWDARLSWSPQGDRIAVAAARGDDPRLRGWSIEVATGKVSRLDHFSEDREVLSATYLRDGRVALSTYRTRLRIATLPAGGGLPLEVLRDDAEDSFLPSWTPDGSALAFVSGDWLRSRFPWNLDLRLADLSSRPAVAAPLAVTPSEDYGAAFSPDGRWLAFHSHVDATDDLYLRPAAEPSAPLVRLTSFREGDMGEPDWSSDGRFLTFVAKDRVHVLEVDPVRGLAAGAPRTLTLEGFAGEAWGPRFSPDGRWIAFLGKADGGMAALYQVAAGGGRPRKLAPVRGPATNSGPAWCHDGRCLYVSAADRRGRQRIYRLELPTGRLRTVTPPEAGALFPRVSPDGRQLAVTLWALEIDVWLVTGPGGDR